MSSFSQRKGLKPITVEFQLDEVSLELRNGLWNVFTSSFLSRHRLGYHDNPRHDRSVKYLFESLWHDYFKETLDEIGNWNSTYENLKRYFFDAEWNEVYDFLEFALNHYKLDKYSSDYAFESHDKNHFISGCNLILERENSAYRFVNTQIVEITSQEEIQEIETAANSKFGATRKHIQSALSLLADKKNPDFRNSIKESISAVEATCNSLLGNSKSTLGQALDELESKSILKLHKAEKKAYQALYGYTSDAAGIRHALLDDSEILDYNDAKFMLVSCSAFCNYLISKSGI